MPYKIFVTKTAKKKFFSILKYIRFRLKNPDSADSFLDDLEISFDFL